MYKLILFTFVFLVFDQLSLSHFAFAQEVKQRTVTPRVVCKSFDAGHCPENVGQILYLSLDNNIVKSLNTCTGFLITDELLMTNAHCLSQSDRVPGQNILGKVFFIFPETLQRAAELIPVSSVALVSPKYDSSFNTPDYLVLKLAKKTTRAPIELARSGLFEDETLTVYKIDPIGLGEGLLRREDCQIKHKTLSFAQTAVSTGVGPFHLTAGLSGCEIMNGNSGSPLLNAKGQAQAIVFAVDNALTLADKLFQGLGLLDSDNHLDRLGYAVNMACLATGIESLDRGLIHECVSHYDSDWQKMISSNLSYLTFLFNSKIQQQDFKNKNLASVFRWKMQLDSIPFWRRDFKQSDLYFLVPECIYPYEQWPKRAQNEVKKMWFLPGKFKKNAYLNLQLPVMNLNTRINRSHQLSYDIDTDESVDFFISLSPSDLFSMGKTHYNLSVSQQTMKNIFSRFYIKPKNLKDDYYSFSLSYDMKKIKSDLGSIGFCQK